MFNLPDPDESPAEDDSLRSNISSRERRAFNFFNLMLDGDHRRSQAPPLPPRAQPVEPPHSGPPSTPLASSVLGSSGLEPQCDAPPCYPEETSHDAYVANPEAYDFARWRERRRRTFRGMYVLCNRREYFSMHVSK